MITAIRKRLEDREEGFTLIELLVVVIIIGILAAVAIPVFLGQRERGFRAAVQSDLRNAAVEAETFFTDNQTYLGFDPTTLDTSTGVSLTAALTPFTGSNYCIRGNHADLPTGDAWSIGPGGLFSNANCAGTP